jgi:predicted nuclease of predicted toxin-antitoxin system
MAATGEGVASHPRVKLLLDMNLSTRWVKALAAVGYVAVPWREVGDRRASDSEIMDFARLHGYVVLTHDLDFGDMLAMFGQTGPSVVQIRAKNVKLDRVFELVVDGINSASEALQNGALVTIDTQRARVRMLPFRPLP